MKKPLLISACLTGANCKYSGGNNYCPAVERLREQYELLPVCPESDGGLPTPRPPAERQGDRVVNAEGVDVTAEYRRGAEMALATAQAHGCTLALLKERSPSCGCGAIYDGTFSHTLVPGHGVAAELLMANGIHVLGESQVEELLCPPPDGQRHSGNMGESSTVTLALLQIAPGRTREENLEKGLRFCREAKARGADLALFPEMWSNGYDIEGRTAQELSLDAIPLNSSFVQSFGALAKELDLAIGITLLETYSPAPRNTLVLFDRFGRQQLVYAKVHTCDFGDERNLTPGEDFCVAALDTPAGQINVGGMICYDREFPESALVLMLRGAELILVPNACPMEINRLAQLRARAFENMVAIATCNYPETVPDCNGGSSVFDGVAYLPQMTESRDTCILQAGGEEGIYLAQLDLSQLRAYRSAEVHGNAYRRPQKYGPLVDTNIDAPFIRDDRRP